MKNTTKEFGASKFKVFTPMGTQKDKATPRPWSIRKSEDGSIAEFITSANAIIDGADGLLLAEVSDQNLKDTSIRNANASLIINAVNNHDVLLEALQQAVEALEGFGCEDVNNFKKVLEKAQK